MRFAAAVTVATLSSSVSKQSLFNKALFVVVHVDGSTISQESVETTGRASWVKKESIRSKMLHCGCLYSPAERRDREQQEVGQPQRLRASSQRRGGGTGWCL